MQSVMPFLCFLYFICILVYLHIIIASAVGRSLCRYYSFYSVKYNFLLIAHEYLFVFKK